MQGRRIPTPPSCWQPGECPYRPGDYWKDADGRWSGLSPNGLLTGLGRHHVEELADGTINVVGGPWGSNSILVSDWMGQTWHGFIEAGVWREC